RQERGQKHGGRVSITTTAEVLARLDDILAQCQRDGDRLGYFAALYRRVTAAVYDGIQNGRFLDAARMERFDVRFANRYFDALDAYRAGKEVTACWRVAFDSCKRRELTILQHLYIGLGAHLMLDLGIAAAESAPGSLIMDLHGDFNEITVIVG